MIPCYCQAEISTIAKASAVAHSMRHGTVLIWVFHKIGSRRPEHVISAPTWSIKTFFPFGINARKTADYGPRMPCVLEGGSGRLDYP